MTNNERIQSEAEIATVADMIQNGIEVLPGKTFTWQARFGDEGPGSWTRGTSEATAEMIAAAKEFLGLNFWD